MYAAAGIACFAGCLNYMNHWRVISFLALVNLANGVNTATEPALQTKRPTPCSSRLRASQIRNCCRRTPRP